MDQTAIHQQTADRGILAVLVLPVGILAYFSYQTAGSTLESELTHSAQGNVSELNSVLENMLEGKLKAIDYYSESITKEKLNTKINRYCSTI